MQESYLQTNIMRMCEEYSEANRLKEIPRLIANARIESFEHGIIAALKFVREYNQQAKKHESAFSPKIILTDGDNA